MSDYSYVIVLETEDQDGYSQDYSVHFDSNEELDPVVMRSMAINAVDIPADQALTGWACQEDVPTIKIRDYIIVDGVAETVGALPEQHEFYPRRDWPEMCVTCGKSLEADIHT